MWKENRKIKWERMRKQKKKNAMCLVYKRRSAVYLYLITLDQVAFEQRKKKLANGCYACERWQQIYKWIQ